ncbi:MAG: hypothetical protein LQ350_006510 [Teloschistes chrysophthalmus]|nr:MAG: hypothetical protein LQ350_006510 [Niorma chrysophthalma]
MVQSLPSDRMIHVQIPVGKHISSGVSALVVWAHHVLDLTVVVQLCGERGLPKRYERFGSADVHQVFIEEVAAECDASITLLDAQQDILLRITSEPDEEDRLISSVRRIPARGYGNTLFEDHIRRFFPGRKETKAIIQELQKVTSAFAIIIARNLDKVETQFDIDNNVTRRRNGMKHYVDEDRLLQASRFLFDNAHLSHQDIDGLVAQYSGSPLQDTLPQPAALESAAWAQSQTPIHDVDIEDNWYFACAHARDLSILAISLAHVTNPEDCENLRFVDVEISSIREVALGQQLLDWNGRDALRITDDAWLQALAVPPAGYQTQLRSLPWHNICLISDRGWSAWISTLAQHDPEQIKAGSITLSRGSPCRNGVWKSAICDPSESLQSWTNPSRAESYGQVAHLRCAKKVTLDKPDCSEGVDAFFVRARLRRHEALAGVRARSCASGTRSYNVAFGKHSCRNLAVMEAERLRMVNLVGASRL